MRNKNYIDRTFLRLSTIFTIIKSFALLSIKKKKPYLSHKYPISKWFGTSLHQKEIKKIRPNPPKYPSILFPNFSTFILIQTLALLTHPLSKTFTLTTVTLAHSILPRRIHRRHPISNFDTQLPAENVNTLHWKGGREAGNHTRRAISRGIRWVEYIGTTRRFQSDAVSRCWYLDSPWPESISRINSAN